MKNFRKFVIGIVLLALIIGFGAVPDLYAQCAMCRAAVENNINSGLETKGSTLNIGILYLFAAPYLLISIVGVVCYRKFKKRTHVLQA